jgi:hypothetical protein
MKVLEELPEYDCKSNRHCWIFREEVACRIRLFWFWSYVATKSKYECRQCKAVKYKRPISGRWEVTICLTK